MWYVWIALLTIYMGVTWQSLREASAPALSCHQEHVSSESPPFSPLNCFRPVVRVGDQLTIQLQLFLDAYPYIENGNVRAGQSIGRTGKKFPRWVSVDACKIHLEIPAIGKLPKFVTSVSDSEATKSLEKDDKKTRNPDDAQHCEVIFPPIARQRSKEKSEVRPLKARFVILERTPSVKVRGISEHASVRRNITNVIGTMPSFFLTTPIQKSKTKSLSRLLLNSGSTTIPSQDRKSNGRNPSNKKNYNKEHHDDSIEWIPYLKFGRSPIRIRFVAEDRGYAFLQRADGVSLNALNSSFYAPIIYVDELSLQKSTFVELAPFEDHKPPVKLQIKLGSITPMMDTLYRQVKAAFEVIEENIFHGSELDELKYFLQDEKLYRFMLTNIISMIHMWFDYLAFRDEVRFYRGKQNLSGISSSTVIGRTMCSMIILLYLIDGGGTSWLVLFSLVSSFLVEVWKVFKLLRPKITSKFPFFAIRQLTSEQELKTTEYDRIACRKLSMIFYPILFCWSVYALKTYEYRSVYSWFISNLANGVYTFGFISMCPQLYVNYRLKSVAHLPWKVFMYKIFNTFVDDAFAWLIEMPLKHRLMTLRDDLEVFCGHERIWQTRWVLTLHLIVFVIFLMQVYLYRVDKTRSNEYGYSYDEYENEKGKQLMDRSTKHDNTLSSCIVHGNQTTQNTPINKLKAE